MAAGISIQVKSSVFTGLAPLPSFSGDEIASYTHALSAIGGYGSANIMLVGNQVDLEEWLEYGLVRDITIYDEAQQVIWNGFVNSVAITLGRRTIERGPVMDIVNKLSVVYTPIDTSVNPPVTGDKTTTPIVQDAASQARYGILEDIFSAGECTDADALIIRDTFLEENKDPGSSESLSTEGGTPSITLTCVGYVEYLSHFIYQSASVVTQTITAKLQAVLAAEPNSIFSIDYTGLAVNTLAVPEFEDRERSGWDVILGEVAKGNAVNTRYTFGVYEGRKAFYAPVPTTIDYQAQLSTGDLETYSGLFLFPWAVLPARWLFYSDFMIGRNTLSANLRDDPRVMFIEGVTFTAPYSVSLEGGRVGRLSQIMARLGLGGSA